MMQSENMHESMQDNLIDDTEQEMLDIIEELDIEEEDKKRIVACMRKEEFKGPLPHPALLQQYAEIESDFPKEILQMAIREQDHRHLLEKHIVSSETSLDLGQLEIIRASIKLKSRLQLFGFFITTLLIVLGAILLFLDKNASSVATFVLAIGSFCWTMFYGKKTSGKDVEEQTEDEEP